MKISQIVLAVVTLSVCNALPQSENVAEAKQFAKYLREGLGGCMPWDFGAHEKQDTTSNSVFVSGEPGDPGMCCRINWQPGEERYVPRLPPGCISVYGTEPAELDLVVGTCCYGWFWKNKEWEEWAAQNPEY